MPRSLRPGLIALLAISAYAQVPLTPGDAAVVQRLFYQTAREGELACKAQPFKPFLDFAFRFEAGYTLRCPLREFEGKADTLYTLVRVTPRGGKPILLGESFAIPAIPPAIRNEVNLRHLLSEAEVSGVFALGEGSYDVELLVVDGHRRAFRKSWTATALARNKEKNASMAMPPNSAGSAMALATHQNGNRPPDPSGPRLTVLLDAAPLQPWSPKLRAWDRAFLLQSLSSLLADTPYASVRLVAFNLDQQQEVFRQNDFRRSDFSKLSIALRSLELGKISYRTLQNQPGWSELLARLVNEEAASEDPADAVIFLGPRNRIEEKVPQSMLKFEGAAPHLFYFEYFAGFGRDFPDTVHYLTTACKGTVLKLHTPAELAEAIRKMQRLLKQGSVRTQSTYLPARPLSLARKLNRQTEQHPPSNFSTPEEYSQPSH